MKPLLQSGCLLHVVPLTERPRIGDIVLYRLRETGQMVAHRVTTSTADVLRTKGDACWHADGPVSLTQVLGRVAAVEEPFHLPLDGPAARVVGRLIGWAYPRLVKLKIALAQVSVRLAGGGIA